MALEVTYRPTNSKAWHQAIITNLDGSITHLLEVGHNQESSVIEVAPEQIEPIPTNNQTQPNQTQCNPGQIIQLNLDSEQGTTPAYVVVSVIRTPENTHLECMETITPFSTRQFLESDVTITEQSMPVSEHAQSLKSGNLAYFNFSDEAGLIISRVDHLNGKSMIELAIGERRIYGPLHMFRPA
ncbi:hypothetical protein ACP3V3_02470 [Vibrio sp. PNB22_3_1]